MRYSWLVRRYCSLCRRRDVLFHILRAVALWVCRVSDRYSLYICYLLADSVPFRGRYQVSHVRHFGSFLYLNGCLTVSILYRQCHRTRPVIRGTSDNVHCVANVLQHLFKLSLTLSELHACFYMFLCLRSLGDLLFTCTFFMYSCLPVSPICQIFLTS